MMNVRNLILVPAALALWACAAQAAAPGAVWTVRQNFPVGRDCRVNASAGDAQGNLYLVGSIDNGNDEDYFVAKVDGATDSLLWTSVYNGPDNNIDQATGCSLDSMGNLYVTGFSHNGTDFDVLTIKYSTATGAQGWVKRYNTGLKTNEYASSCAADRFGNLIVTGTCNEDTLYESCYHEDYHILALKYDGASGDTIWSKHLNNLPDSLTEANDCCVDDSGNAYLTGYSASNAWTFLALTLRLNTTDGAVEWINRFNQTGKDVATCCAIRAGDLYVAGFDNNYCFAMKLNAANGDTVWVKNITANSMMPSDCGLGSDGRLFVAATRAYYYGYEYEIIKYDTDTGDTLWARTYSHHNPNILLSLVMDKPGVVTVLSSGVMGEYPGQLYSGMFAAKYSAETGFFLDSCSYSQSIPGGGWNYAYDCAVAGADGPSVAGISGLRYTVVKYNPTNGQTKWANRISHAKTSRATGIDQDASGVYTVGHYGFCDCLLAYKFDLDSGDSLWVNRNAFGTFWTPLAVDCALDKQGGLFLSGFDPCSFWDGGAKINSATGDSVKWCVNESFGDNRQTGCTADETGDFYLLSHHYDGAYKIIKYENTTGDTVWTRAFNVFGADPDDAHGIAGDNGYFYVAGSTYNGTGLDYFLSKHSTATGDTAWCKKYDSPFHLEDRAFSCAVDDSGFVYLTGASHNGTGYDYWTLKCTPDGDTLWSVRYNGPDNLNDFARGCCVDSLGYLYVTGFSATGRGYDMVTIKYNTGYTGVGSEPGTTSAGIYFVGPVYPNPSRNGRITVQYNLPAAGRVDVSVYNIAGQLVRKLDQGKRSGGAHQIVWDGNDRNGHQAASGVYLLRCDLGGLSATRKVLVVR
jgi:hypothetical protein